MSFLGLKLPDKPFQKQRPMMRVSWALSPLVLASVYFFGLRSLALLLVVLAFGALSEAVFTFRQGKPVTSAVLVTCLIFYLSLPPTIPFWMAIIGIVAGVVLGKMVFGGFGQNVFNPAMVGRCFIYINFPVAMTGQWAEPAFGGLGGLVRWTTPKIDAVTGATPLHALHQGEAVAWWKLFVGDVGGSLGETSALLIVLCGLWIIYKKAAPWRLAVSCLIGGVVLSGLLNLFGADHIPGPLLTLLSGSFLFGAFFIVTEPISGAKTKPGQWVYGFLIGGLIVVLRGYSNFPEGVMFSVLLFNAFVPILDQTVQDYQKRAKARREQQQPERQKA
jgi:Na+-transporting NADH:ubiquinone oxidoreductase subunit B